MFKLQKPNNKLTKPRDRVDFKFSNFQALQVPKGWDRLFVSLISVETGKTLAKLGKALVRNGNCQWTETLLESFLISQNDSSKESEECLIKLLVSTGSARSSILGEVTINVAQYTSARVSAAVSQPLKKCSHGTTLQVKIQCLTPRSKNRNEESKRSNSEDRDLNTDNLDTGNKSNVSDNSSDGTVGPPSEDLAIAPRLMKLDSKVISRPASSPYRSFDSPEGSIRKENLSSRNDLKSEEYYSPGRGVEGSYDDSPPPDNYSVNEDSASNQSSLNSRQYLREDLQNETVVARSSMSNVGSSKNLLEAAEDTIEELRAEAKMWERNARKLVIDLDVSRKEFSDQSKKQAELIMELSSAYAEHDGLKREIEQLKLKLQESMAKQCTQEDSSIQSESLIHIQRILENEIKYQQSVNANLGDQLNRSQESNLQLVSVLRELEETIERQKDEIESLSSLKLEFADLENSIARNSEDNKTLLLQLQKLQETEKTLQADIQLLDQALKDKTDELENARKSNTQFLSHVEKDYKSQISLKEEEISRLEAELSHHVNNENKVDLLREIESLKEKVQELEKDCTELTDENLELLFKLKESNKTDIRKCASFGSISSENPTICPSDDSEVSDPKLQISHLDEELVKKLNEEVKNAGFESCEHFADILKQLEMAFHLLMKPWAGISLTSSQESKNFLHDLMNANKANATANQMSAECIYSFLLELNCLLEMRVAECEDILQSRETEIHERNAVIADAEKKMEDCILEVQSHEQSKTNIQENYANLLKEMDQVRFKVDLIEGNLRSKEAENMFLVQRQSELESEIAEIQQRKSHLEQNMDLVLKEKNVTSECLQNLQNDVTVLHNSVDFHVSANTILERKLEELERKRQELEKKLLVLREENLQLRECICGLEAETRHLKDEREFFKQEADNSKSVAMSLQEEMQKLKDEMETQMLHLKQKSEDMQKQWLKTQKECEDLKAESQASAASFTQERMKLQNSISEMNKENQELQENCSEMVAQLTKSKKSLSDCTKKIESLEDHLNSMLEDFVTREKGLKFEVDALIQEIQNHEEKLALKESLHQEFLEKTVELENLQNKVEHLTRQISDAHEERKIISFEASCEVSRLLTDKAELQSALQEVQSKVELTTNALDAVRLESESKLKGLTSQLAASQQSHEILMTNHERILKLLANYKKSEEKLKTDRNDLELKLTISDYERQQLTKEMSILKVQLQNMLTLQDEISILKGELQACKLEKDKLELAFQTVTGDYKEMRAENVLFAEKISSFQVAIAECEESKRRNLALEEKLLQMESELTAKAMLCSQNSNLKNELAETKRANMQFQQKIYRLEEEKNEFFKKAQTLEKELELMEDRYNFCKERAIDGDFLDESPLAVSVDQTTRLQLLGSEFAGALDAINNNRVQHDSPTTSSHKVYEVAPKKSAVDGGVVTRQKYERTKSSLATELRDLRERYLEMSLKYAEVEAQRENLVMKLKATNSGKRWFS